MFTHSLCSLVATPKWLNPPTTHVSIRAPPHYTGTSCLCATFTQFWRNFLGSDNLNFADVFPANCSRREEGLPAKPVPLAFKSLDNLLMQCKQSRLHAGVHFQKSIDAGVDLCKSIGDKCYKRVKDLMG